MSTPAATSRSRLRPEPAVGGYSATWRAKPTSPLHAVVSTRRGTLRLACTRYLLPANGSLYDYRYATGPLCGHRACRALFTDPEEASPAAFSAGTSRTRRGSGR